MKNLAIILFSAILCGCALMDNQQNVQPYEPPLKKYISNPVSYYENDSIPDENSININNPLRPTEENIEAGKKLYRYFCHHCHGVNLDGNGPVGESMMKKPPDLRSTFVASQTDKDIFLTLSNGKGLSPALKWSMLPIERWKVIVYLRSLK